MLSEQLMLEFAENTEITGDKPPRRYLLTDAFAVCNFLGLYEILGDEKYIDLATKLVYQVHHILGKHRDDDRRTGWLSSEERPTGNGLRIGKPEMERSKNEPMDHQLEWERDGQYFHYLTKWIHALLRIGQVTEEQKYFVYARDLALSTKKFIHNNRMYWKMSIDLSYPLVSSMGQHDPIDGYVTFKVIEKVTGSDLSELISKMKHIIRKSNFVTNDPLGLGGLLFDYFRLVMLDIDLELQNSLKSDISQGLNHYSLRTHGLAFREFGLAIGLKVAMDLKIFEEYWPLRSEINNYWENNRDWSDHRDINQVMLATSLSPEGFLSI